MNPAPLEDAGDGRPERTEEAETLSDVRQFVTFIAGDEMFAVDMAPVQEIIRVPDVVRVPLAPPTLDGLANLRGKVLPIVSLRRACGFVEQAHDDATRALVIDLGQPLGFVVDRVVSVIGVEPGKIEDAAAVQGTAKTDLLSGVIKDVAGHAMIMVLDFAKLIERELTQLAGMTHKATGTDASGGATAGAAEQDEVIDELQLVSFTVDGQEYGIPIQDVQEIVHVPANIVHVPRSDQNVLGVMTLRSRLLPLVSLRRMFGLSSRPADEQSRVVVVRVGEASVGLVMDRVNEVLRVPRASVDGVPGLLAREGSLTDISDICKLDGGKRLVSVISTRSLFRNAVVQGALQELGEPTGERSDASSDEEADMEHDDDEQVVVFRLDKEEFGVPIASVQEIVRVPETLIHVPKAPPFVEGVINLRGAVLPVMDLRRRLGLPAVPRSDRQRVMVFLIDGTRTGFIVDSVAEVLKVPKRAIEPAPPVSSEQVHLLARMANLQQQKRLVQLMDPAYLVDHGDAAQLAALGN